MVPCDEPSLSPSTRDYAETELLESSTMWLKAIKAGEYREAQHEANRFLCAWELLHGDDSPKIVPGLYVNSITLLYKERVKQRNSCTAKFVNMHLDGVAGGCRSQHRTPGWPGRERAETLNFDDLIDSSDGIDEMTDSDWALYDLGVARTLMNTEQSIRKVEILEAIGDVFYERGDLKFAHDYYVRALSTLESLGEEFYLRIAVLNFKLCLVLVGACELDEARGYWLKGISIAKYSFLGNNFDNNFPDGMESSLPNLDSVQERMMQRKLVSNLEQMEDWLQVVKRGWSSLEELLKNIIKDLCELIDVNILESEGMRVKLATFIPGDDVRGLPDPSEGEMASDVEMANDGRENMCYSTIFTEGRDGWIRVFNFL